MQKFHICKLFAIINFYTRIAIYYAVGLYRHSPAAIGRTAIVHMQIACKLLRHSERPRVILSEAKNLLWTKAQFSTLHPLFSARDSSLRYAPFENDGQKMPCPSLCNVYKHKWLCRIRRNQFMVFIRFTRSEIG